MLSNLSNFGFVYILCSICQL